MADGLSGGEKSIAPDAASDEDTAVGALGARYSGGAGVAQRGRLQRRPVRGYRRAMMAGTPIDETGTLLREGGGFVLRADDGARWSLDLHRVPVDHVEKRVRVQGVHVGGGRIDVDGVAPA